MTTITRTDIHRPSAINPDDYDFVGVEYAKIETIDDAYSLGVYRERIITHMKATGGHYSGHHHGGNCHVCGAHCIYTALFYHPATNTYIRTGFDCAEKMHVGDPAMFRAFREDVRRAIDNKAGKAKARAVLAEAGLEKVWEIYILNNAACYPGYDEEAMKELIAMGAVVEYSGVLGNSEEMRILLDLIGKLIRYGSLSEKQIAFAGKLLDKMLRRNEIAAARAAEHASAADCPTGKIAVEGTILSIKEVDSPYGLTTKMLIQHADGWKVWGTMPSAIRGAERGAKVRFIATVTRSNDDSKFGFFSRPTKAEIME